MLTGKKILVGVTGSIAAYKSAYLVRELIRLGADVRCILTPAAREFITPLTLSTLSKNPVAVDFVKPEKEGKAGEWENHVKLGMWADLFIIAPLSANTLSKLVTGNCDNLLMAVYLSAKCPVWIAPAMDLDMYNHFSTKENLDKLKSKGIKILDAKDGELASGLEGKGRMEEPYEIAKEIDAFFNPQSKLKGKKILITGGPTYEAIDPVRFIGNHSSGKTGVLLADACAARGAEVFLITGPTREKVKNPYVRVLHVQSADEMMSAVEHNWFDFDAGIFSAAVADYRPENKAPEKIKKSDDRITLNLIKNPDILKWAGLNKKAHQRVIGFALETENEIENAQKKLEQKRADLIVLNSLKDEGAGFGHDTNKVTFVQANNKIRNFELSQKSVLMSQLLDELEQMLS
ncbi:MAG: bifunctional phosphopantothenoylcysteine decarboxylase/phosphopantothenate--cysteine ligase CoaBC [Crocinitomicaceae bacterium]|nr:bifunctional phosphopantothenoylcysteine decarboxylase/phosphopantothenate--cysteine ligase CoaBC [Crocinitomicaceae bacterium]